MPRGVYSRGGRVQKQSFSDTAVLEAALVGLEHQKRQIDEKITELRSRLGIRSRANSSYPATVTEGAPRKKRVLSAAARKAISEATRKRWAAYRKAKGK